MSKPAILKSGDLSEICVAELSNLFDVLVMPENPEAAAKFLAEHGPRIRGIALRDTRIDAEFLAKLPALEIISNYSVGLNHLDVATAQARGIRIATPAIVSAPDVADVAVGLIIDVTRQVQRSGNWMRAGHWHKDYPLARSLNDMTIGIVGLGTIGRSVAHRLQGFNVHLAYTDCERKAVEFDFYPDLIALAKAADVLLITCPLTAETRHMINADVLAALGPDSFLVNVARGAIVDERALLDALQSETIAGAALDVFEFEPAVPEELLINPKVVVSPHIGSATKETRQRMADYLVDVLAQYFGLSSPRLAVAE